MSLKIYLAGCVAAATLVSCSNTADILERSRFLAEQHQFHKAYWLVVEAWDDDPFNPELRRAFWERRMDYLLDRGQQLVFQERESEAIAEFQKVLALDPENRSAKAWIQRAKTKLAAEAMHLADARRHEGELEGALQLYNEALSYVPELPEAVAGIKEVNEQFLNRADKSAEHYVLGSRARGEQRFQQSYYHAGIATDLDESNERAKKLYGKSARRIAAERLANAEDMEAKGFYAAALQDYRRVKMQLPDTKGLAAKIAAMEREVEARNLCRDAAMLTRKKKFDEADALLSKAFEKTEFERATVSGLMLEAKHLRYEEAYLKAKDRELDYRFEEALAAFRAIDKAFPSRGFLDVKARISGLESHIAEAKKSWVAGQEAEKAGKYKEAIDYYSEAVLVYPGYQGLEAKIKELKSRVGS